MQLRDIQYVLTVAQELSFSKAAGRLHVSQPALSQCIKKLEASLSVSLFIREHNTVRLTEAGELFVREGREILERSMRLEQMMSTASTSGEPLRVGISPFYSRHYLPRILPLFRGRYPDVVLQITESHSVALARLITEDEIDVALIPLPVEAQGVDMELICEEQIVFVMPANHRLSEQLIPDQADGLPSFDLRLARNEPFVFLRAIQTFTKMGLDLCREAGFSPNIILETVNWDTVHALVGAGLGVGFVPEMLAYTPTAGDRPLYCRLMGQTASRGYVAVFKQGKPPSSAARQFIGAARESLRYNRN